MPLSLRRQTDARYFKRDPVLALTVPGSSSCLRDDEAASMERVGDYYNPARIISASPVMMCPSRCSLDHVPDVKGAAGRDGKMRQKLL